MTEFDDKSFDEQVECEVNGGAAEEKKRDTQAQQLAKISTAAGLFHAPNGTGFADISIGGHRETWPIRSKGFRKWLMRELYKRGGMVRTSNCIQTGLGLMEAVAVF